MTWAGIKWRTERSASDSVGSSATTTDTPSSERSPGNGIPNIDMDGAEHGSSGAGSCAKPVCVEVKVGT
jgi:hypothetical protein